MNPNDHYEKLRLFFDLYMQTERGNKSNDRQFNRALKRQFRGVVKELEAKYDSDNTLETNLHAFNSIYADIIKGDNNLKDGFISLAEAIKPELVNRNRPIMGISDMVEYVSNHNFPVVQGKDKK